MSISKREYRHQQIKKTILQTARQLISEAGVDSFSMREIARRLEYSPAGLYEYFSSKDELATAVCAESLERLRTYLSSPPDHLPPLQRLLLMGLAYLDFARAHPEHFHFIFMHLPDLPPSFGQQVRADSPYQLLLEVVAAAIEAGEIKPRQGYSVEEMAYSLWALVHGLAVLEQTHVGEARDDLETIHRMTLQIFGQGLQLDEGLSRSEEEG